MANLSFYQSTIFLYFLLQVFSIPFTEASKKGFSAEIIHRDSPKSPWYDSSISQKERLNFAIERSLSRLSYFKSALHIETNRVKSPTTNTNSRVLMGIGEYLMELSIGTPPFKQLAIMDTGSDITWTQCRPCHGCYKQKQSKFNAKKSSTFRPLKCNSSPCEELQVEKTCYKAANTTCKYRLSYGDESYSEGVLATETYTIGGTSIPKLLYGCSHGSHGTFRSDSSGIVGLGGGSLSLINQFKKHIQRKFSYCLLSDHANNAKNANSKINFGSNAVVSGSNVVSTPMIKPYDDTYYYLTLEGMSVGKSRFNYNETTRFGKAGPIKEGNIIIDSGTTLSFLPSNLCNNLEDSMRREIKAEPIEDTDGYFNLCYEKTKDFTAPVITAHFAGGADLKLPWTSTFYVEEDTACLAFTASEDLNIYGNMAQRDYLIGFDLEKKRVSFKPTDCSKK